MDEQLEARRGRARMKYSALSKYRTELMGLAMLWVMLYHAWSLDLGLRLLNAVRAFGFGGVDIFILLSAMGLTMSLCRREQKFGPFMARRALRILPAYFVVMLPYTLFLVLRRGAPVSAFLWNSTLLSYWFQTPGRFNWYVSGIMVFYLLTPPCVRLLKKAKHRAVLTAAGMAAGLVLCFVLMKHELWQYLDVPYRIPIFFLGLLMGFYAREERGIGKKGLLFWCFWLLCGLAYFAAAVRSVVKVVYLPPSLLLLFTTLPLCLVCCFLFERLPLGGLRRFLRLVGESSLEIYLLNVSLFAELDALQRYLPFNPRHCVYYLLAFALNIFLGACFHRLMEFCTAKLRARQARNR